MNALLRYLVLPSEVSPREHAHLARINRVALAFFWAHVPVFAMIAFANNTGAAAAALMTSVVVAGPTILVRFLPPRLMSPVFGFVAMCLGGILVHFGQGIVQIEMHFYFFVLLALLAVFGNPMAIIVAAVTVAAHHALLWLLLPESVFNYAAPFWVVGIHAGFVVIESAAACFVARSFFDDVIGLEKIIDLRTSEMRLILDTVSQGLVVVKKDGAMLAGRSAILDRWLGAAAPDDTFFTWLARAGDDQSRWLRMCFDGLFEDVLPLEVALAQMPRDIVVSARILELAVHIMPEQDAAMLALVDVTAQRAATRAELVQRDTTALFERLIKDKRGVAELVDEGNGIVRRLVERRAVDTADARRLAHTLKGNAGMFGLMRVVQAAHELETSIGDDGTVAAVDHFSALARVWDETVSTVRPLLVDDGRLDVSAADLAGLQAAVMDGLAPGALSDKLGALKDERARGRLDRLTEQAHLLAVRLGKGLVVRVDCDDELRLPSRLRPFWAASVHLIRNAIDHGIEPRDARTNAGKSPSGAIVLSLTEHGDDVVFVISDDGRGIDWGRIGDAARARGLPFLTESDRVSALFADGLSTAESVNEISGRGIGMEAVRSAARACGGELTVTSTPGAGTRVAARFPRGTGVAACSP